MNTYANTPTDTRALDPLLNNPPPNRGPSPDTQADFERWQAQDDALRTVPLHMVSKAYGISRSTLRHHVSTGRLQAVRVGRYKQVTIECLKKFLGHRPAIRVPVERNWVPRFPTVGMPDAQNR